MGMRSAEAKDAKSAARHFAAQAFLSVTSRDAWANLGSALVQLSEASHDVETMIACHHVVVHAVSLDPTSKTEIRKLKMIRDMMTKHKVGKLTTKNAPLKFF